jgi:hypothetical protein
MRAEVGEASKMRAGWGASRLVSTSGVRPATAPFTPLTSGCRARESTSLIARGEVKSRRLLYNAYPDYG